MTPELNPSTGLPASIVWGGVQTLPTRKGDQHLLTFTDLITRGTFTIPIQDYTPQELCRRTAQMREGFQAQGSFNPTAAKVLAACFAVPSLPMFLALLLILCSCAQAKPTQPGNLRFSPFVESIYFPDGHLRETHTIKPTSDGRYWMHTISYPNGKTETRVFPFIQFRVNPSTK